MTARAELPRPTLMLVTDSARLHGRDLAEVVAAAVEGGVDAVQLREKSLRHHHLLALGERIRDAIAGRALLLINGDTDATLALRAGGVHLPDAATATTGMRARAGDRLLISCAVHDLDAARRAEREGADILVLGTVFPSTSHRGGPTIGLDGLRAVCDAVKIPVVAIGGITENNAGDVIRAGASGVAVISAIFDAPDPRAAATALRAAIDHSVPPLREVGEGGRG
ncbi:MAG: thiamine phosphate synthase [Dehalococcoidia bacterium]